MKYMIIIATQGIRAPLNHNGKIIYFDKKEDATDLIDNSYLSIRKDEIEIADIDISEINDDKYINYRDALIHLAEI